MSLEQWSFLAEILASAAVVASLCFVAFQIRVQTRDARQQAMDLITSQRVAHLRALTDDSEMTRILWRGFAKEPPLPKVEWARFTMFLYVFFLEIERAWMKFDAGVLDRETWASWEDGIRWWLRQPGVRSWWKMDHPGYSPRFEAYVARRLAEVPIEPAEAAAVVAAMAQSHPAPAATAPHAPEAAGAS
jgi:hypothetical protein